MTRNPDDGAAALAAEADAMRLALVEFDAALEQLEADSSDEDTGQFVLKRLAEGRALAEHIGSWAESVTHIQQHNFLGLAKVDQQQLAERTEQQRMAMLEINTQLAGQFPSGVPEKVQAIVSELQQVMEAITFNQVAAAFSLEGKAGADAESQQMLAVESFERAQELFDQMRRLVVDELDKIDPEDPNIADLEDPTLDQLLQRLEREPDLDTLLGLGQRPRNLRIVTDWMVWEEQGAGGAEELADEAARRARRRAEEEMRMARQKPKPAENDTDKSDEEWQKVADAETAQELLEKKIRELKEKAAAPETDAAETEKLLQMAKQLEALRQQLGNRDISADQWERIVRSDQMKAVMRAMASGEPMPDSQWNRVLSSLDKGLWQVKRRTPPEAYRRAIEQYQERIRKLTSLGDE
jgi:hypothetical protein